MEKLTGTIIRAIQDKKGKNIVSLDLSKIDGAICSCFIVCNADSTTQVAAIAAGIEEQVLETLGEKVWRVEGQQNAVSYTHLSLPVGRSPVSMIFPIS